MANGDFFPISQSQYGGAIVINVFAILSAVALLSVALRVLSLAFWKIWRPDGVKSRDYIFFQSQLGNYVACLLVGNMMNSTAGLMGLPWLVRKGITDGAVCRAQAFVMQVGNWSSAYFTVAIAIHTLNSLVLKMRQSVFISLPTMVIGWVIAGVAASVPLLLHEPEVYIYGPTGLSCGVGAEFPKLQFLFHLLPIFIASLLSAFLYSLIYLVLRGTLKIKGGIKLTLDPSGRWDGDMEDYHHFIARVAKGLIWYPITYIAFLVPYSVMRLLVISGFNIAWNALVFAFVCWFLLGVANVILLYNTLRILGPAFDSVSSANNSRMTMESFGPTGYFLEKAGAYDGDQRSMLQERIDQYRFPAPLYQQPGEYHSRSSSQASDTGLLQTYHERNTSANSIPGLGRPIPPFDQSQSVRAMLPPAIEKPVVTGNPKSQLSLNTSPRSLPAPPHRNVSPFPVSIYNRTSGTDASGSPIVPEGTRTPVTQPATRQLFRLPSATFGEQNATVMVSHSWSSGNQSPSGAASTTFASPGYGPRALVLATSPRTSPHSPNYPTPAYLPKEPRPLTHSRNSSAVGSSPGTYRPLTTLVPQSF